MWGTREKQRAEKGPKRERITNERGVEKWNGARLRGSASTVQAARATSSIQKRARAHWPRQNTVILGDEGSVNLRLCSEIDKWGQGEEF